MKQVSFTVSPADSVLIRQIVDRALGRARMDLEMDITATHANGNPLKLGALLIASDFNFAHDIMGIQRHLDRDTGELTDCFSPRYSA